MDIAAEIAKAEWVINQNRDKPHVVAKWTKFLESIKVEQSEELVVWVARARVALNNIERLLVPPGPPEEPDVMPIEAYEGHEPEEHDFHDWQEDGYPEEM